MVYPRIVEAGAEEMVGAHNAAGARIAADERAILANFGHPQPPTPLYCDNECAVGIANSFVTQKMSKSLDMRLHWVRDRARQGQFVVQNLPGLQNIADFFTKALPVARHKDLAPFLALDDDQTIDDIVNAKLKLSALLFAACILTPASCGYSLNYSLCVIIVLTIA